MKKSLFVIGSLLIAQQAHASIKSEVEAERYKKQGSTFTDTWTGVVWEDSRHSHGLGSDTAFSYNKLSYVDAVKYCKNLTLNGISSFRLPIASEALFYKKKTAIRHLLNYKGYGRNSYASLYWTSTGAMVKGKKGVIKFSFYDYKGGPSSYLKRGWTMTRCVSSPEKYSIDGLVKAAAEGKERKIKEKNELNFQQAQEKHTTTALKKFIQKYPDSYLVDKAKNAIVDMQNTLEAEAKQANTIDGYMALLAVKPDQKRTDFAIGGIYKLVSAQNNIAGYEWYLKNLPQTQQAKDAAKNMHKLAFEKAQKVGTVAAYNTFVIAYPYASETTKANDLAYGLEKKAYTDLGMLGFWDKEGKMEKKARKLLIKAKRIERAGKDHESTKAGHTIVANRMYQLLQDTFDESDATLRYLESQDFADFVKVFKHEMRGVKTVLNKINSSTEELGRSAKSILQVSKQGFANASAERNMSEFYAKEHRDWEQIMHLRDKGYM